MIHLVNRKKWRKITAIATAFIMALNLLPAAAIAANVEAREDGAVTINATQFPDETFRNYVATNFDTNDDGSLSTEERNKVTKIDVARQKVQSLEGIEAFNELKILYCEENNLNKLDLSQNLNLEELFCYKNQIRELN